MQRSISGVGSSPLAQDRSTPQEAYHGVELEIFQRREAARLQDRPSGQQAVDHFAHLVAPHALGVIVFMVVSLVAFVAFVAIGTGLLARMDHGVLIAAVCLLAALLVGQTISHWWSHHHGSR